MHSTLNQTTKVRHQASIMMIPDDETKLK